MTKNKIALLLIIVLPPLAFWLNMANKKSTIREELRDFAIEDTGTVSKIFMTDKANHSVLLKKIRPGAWRVNDKYNAVNSGINTLLYTAKNLQVKSPVGKNAEANIIKRLSSGAVKVEFYCGDKLEKVYYVGGETQDQLGTYMLLVNTETMENSSAPFVMELPGFNGYLTTRYFTNESEWRDRVLFSYTLAEIKSVKVEVPPKPEFAFEVLHIGDNTYDVKALAANRSLVGIDTLAIKQYLSYYRNIHFGPTENSLPEAVKDSIVNSAPMHIITVTDTKGAVNTVKLFPKAASTEIQAAGGKPAKYDPDQMYAIINHEQDLVLVQYFVVGKLLPLMDYFKKRMPV